MKLKAWALLGVQLVLIAVMMLLPRGDDWVLPLWASKLAWAMSLLGLGIALAGLLALGRSLSPLPTPVEDGTLRTGGLFRFVRHPIYSGLFVWAIASSLASGSWLKATTALALIVWLNVKARWEEARLAEHYVDYADYAAVTPRFIPGWTRPSPGSAGGSGSSSGGAGGSAGETGGDGGSEGSEIAG